MTYTTRFSDHTFFEEHDRWDRGRVWANGAKTLFNVREVPINLIAVQACSLQSILAFVEGDMATESLYGALAIRMVQLLGLPQKLSSDCVERETEIRGMYSPESHLITFSNL